MQHVTYAWFSIFLFLLLIFSLSDGVGDDLHLEITAQVIAARPAESSQPAAVVTGHLSRTASSIFSVSILFFIILGSLCSVLLFSFFTYGVLNPVRAVKHQNVIRAHAKSWHQAGYSPRQIEDHLLKFFKEKEVRHGLKTEASAQMPPLQGIGADKTKDLYTNLK